MQKAWANYPRPGELQPASIIPRPWDVADEENDLPAARDIMDDGVADATPAVAVATQPLRQYPLRIIFVFPEKNDTDFSIRLVGARHGRRDNFDWRHHENSTGLTSVMDGTLEELYKVCNSYLPDRTPPVVYGALKPLREYPDNLPSANIVQLLEDVQVANWLRRTTDEEHTALCILPRPADDIYDNVEYIARSPARESLPPPKGWLKEEDIIRELVEEGPEVSANVDPLDPLAGRACLRYFAPRKYESMLVWVNQVQRRALRNQQLINDLRRTAERRMDAGYYLS